MPPPSGRHARSAGQKAARRAELAVKHYKVDDELTRRVRRRQRVDTTRVIVTLAPGAKLPAEFQRYCARRRPTARHHQRRRQLDLINGQLLDVRTAC